MANVTVASNAYGRGNVWLPYNHKPFYLGTTGDKNATDGDMYVSQTTGTSDIEVHAELIDEYNCNYYYELCFDASTDMYIKKYTKAGTLIDTIYASDTSGNGRYWGTYGGRITVDIGLVIDTNPTHGNTFDASDVYKINTPDLETMKKRRLYHGGYTTYFRNPETEGVTYRTKIIPTNLKNRNLTILAGHKCHWDSGNGIVPSLSEEDMSGNKAITVALEWNINPQGAESTTAQTIPGFIPPAGETWQIGRISAQDIDHNATPLSGTIVQFPYSDVTSTVGITNVNAVTASGIAGHARIRSEFMHGAGSAVIFAHNQWFPITIILG
tara:strand:- start:881 stop:1858 length:978 start_codon:yes stop_codon:yes gene_type:complete